MMLKMPVVYFFIDHPISLTSVGAGDRIDVLRVKGGTVHISHVSPSRIPRCQGKKCIRCITEGFLFETAMALFEPRILMKETAAPIQK